MNLFNQPDRKCICTAAVSFFSPSKPCHITGNRLNKSINVSLREEEGGGGAEDEETPLTALLLVVLLLPRDDDSVRE